MLTAYDLCRFDKNTEFAVESILQGIQKTIDADRDYGYSVEYDLSPEVQRALTKLGFEVEYVTCEPAYYLVRWS